MKLWRSLLATVLAVMLVLSMSVSAFAITYNDVDPTGSYQEYIEVVDSLGLIPANNVGDFNPKGYYSRGEALITAYRLVNGGDTGLEEYDTDEGLFEDITSEHPLNPYVNWAYDNGLITNELEDKNFYSAEPISGAEFLTLFVKVGGIDPNAVVSSSGEGEEGGSDEEGAEETDMEEAELEAAPMMAAEEDAETTDEPTDETTDEITDETTDEITDEITDEEESSDDGYSGDGEGTVVSDLVYPDSYIEAAYDWCGDVFGDEEKITREMAASTIASLLWYQDSETMIDFASLTTEEGERLDCLATNIYGLNTTPLTIRATAERTMGYDFNGDVLLSNGSILTTEEDLSDYVGHAITITYRDMDNSGTLTVDEEIIFYQVNSMMVLQPTLAEITLTSYTEFKVSAMGLAFFITGGTKFYYNDQIWDEDPINNLITAAGGTGSTITNRPNMTFTVMTSEIFDPEGSNTMCEAVFVEEHRPAKIVDISGGVYTLYDYYARGTDAEYVSFSMNDIEFLASAAAVGDYVNYYVVGDTCYILEGSAITTTLSATGAGNTLVTADGVTLTPHQMYRRSNTMPELNTEIVIVTEDVTGEYYLGWEYPTAKQKTPAMVISYSQNLDSVTYVLYDFATEAQITLEVATDNIYATSEITSGEFIYYSQATDGAYSVERATISDKVKLGVETDSYFVESETGKIYNKSKYYYGNLYTDTFKEDYYKMILDVAGNVLALM